MRYADAETAVIYKCCKIHSYPRSHAFKPGVGQKIALHISTAASHFLVHSTSLFFCPTSLHTYSEACRDWSVKLFLTMQYNNTLLERKFSCLHLTNNKKYINQIRKYYTVSFTSCRLMDCIYIFSC